MLYRVDILDPRTDKWVAWYFDDEEQKDAAVSFVKAAGIPVTLYPADYISEAHEMVTTLSEILS